MLEVVAKNPEKEVAKKSLLALVQEAVPSPSTPGFFMSDMV